MYQEIIEIHFVKNKETLFVTFGEDSGCVSRARERGRIGGQQMQSIRKVQTTVSIDEAGFSSYSIP